MLRWERLLANLPSAVNLFRLLEARPALLELLADMLGLAPPLADELARRADLLDPLIDATAFDLPGTVADARRADAARRSRRRLRAPARPGPPQVSANGASRLASS